MAKRKATTNENAKTPIQYEELDIPIREIIADVDNPRVSLMDEEVDSLAHNIAEHGLLNRIVVHSIEMNGIPSKVPKGVKYEVVTGHKRLAAVTKLKWPKVPCRIAAGADKEQRFLMQLSENEVRSNTPAVDLARSFVRAREEFGKTWKELAEHLGMQPASVRRLAKLASANDAMAKAIDDKTCPTHVAEAICGIPAVDARDDAWQRLVKSYPALIGKGEGGVPSRDSAKRFVQQEYARDVRGAHFKSHETTIGTLPACLSCASYGAVINKGLEKGEAKVNSTTCFNPKCWDEKNTAYSKLVVDRLVAAGARRATEEEVAKMFPHGGGYCNDTNYISATEQLWDLKAGHEPCTIEKDGGPAIAELERSVGTDKLFQVRIWYPRAKARKALRQDLIDAGVKVVTKRPSASGAHVEKERRKRFLTNSLLEEAVGLRNQTGKVAAGESMMQSAYIMVTVLQHSCNKRFWSFLAQMLPDTFDDASDARAKTLKAKEWTQKECEQWLQVFAQFCSISWTADDCKPHGLLLKQDYTEEGLKKLWSDHKKKMKQLRSKPKSKA